MICILVCAAAIARFAPPDTTLAVFAAASLKDAFTTIAGRFESGHAGVHVQLTFAGSQTLAAQINEGAPVDVFASASSKNLSAAHPDASTVKTFVRNRLIIVERSDWNGVHTLRDLSAVPKLVLAADAAPAGHYAGELLNRAAKKFGASWEQTVQSHVVSRELDVRAVLAKVRLGEADAGIVYESDAISAKGSVTTVPIPDAVNPIAYYPVGAFTGSPNSALGRDFIRFLFSPYAQREFARQGFLPVVPLRKGK